MAVRIRATDLRDAARKSSAIRAEYAERGEKSTIYLDIEVAINPDATTASREAEGDLPPSTNVRYIGTPRGLAGLISDVQRLGIADGVILLTPHAQSVTEMMLDELAPGLGHRAPERPVS
ncbi:hypothetical protein ACWDO0_02780 [Nocardia rhamnosiphila]